MGFLTTEMKLLTDGEVRQIHDASLKALKNVGFKVEHERMLKLLREIGADVDFNTMIVKFPPNLVEDCLKKQVFKMNGGAGSNEDYRNISETNLKHPNNSWIATHIFCMNILDMDDDNIRPATLKDLESGAIIANELKNVGVNGPLVVPNDVPVEVNDAYMWATMLTKSKKHASGELFNLDTIPYIADMCSIVAGSEEEMRKNPLVGFPCFPSSPFAYSRYSLDMAFAVIDLKLPVRFGASMVVAGFTGPVTLAGTLTVANAETLGSMVMAEAVGGDCFGIMGVSINCNQTNGTALYASPEKTLLCFANRDIGKFYGMDGWRNFGGHVNGSDACFPGIQAGIEKGASFMFNNIGGAGGGHCGMLSSELASLPQMVIDDEICDYMNRMNEGIKVDEETIAYDLIEHIGIAGSYIDMSSEEALEHLSTHFRRENWLPKLFVRERPQKWQNNREDTLTLAKEKVRRILKENDPCPLGAEKEKEINKVLQDCVKNCVK